MSPEMFLGLGLSGLLIMLSGQSPKPPTKPGKGATITVVLPDCGNSAVQESTLDKR